MKTRSNHFEAAQIQQLLTAQLTDQDELTLASHLEDCAACRRKLEQAAAGEFWWGELRDALTGLASDSPSLGSVEDIAAHVAQRDPLFPLAVLEKSDNPAMLGRLGEFEILERIGSGGMGTVLKGYDHELNRFVAIKILHPTCSTTAAARRRFIREAQAAASIVHSNVVSIHAVAANHHHPYLVMSYIPGESLQQRLNHLGSLELTDALRIGCQVADGLAAAHSQGVVHRDIKPGNILLERNVERVLLTDFGLARVADDASLTQSGIIAGTPQFMSPEQARGESIDSRTDLFSLGAVLYAVLAGHSPFRAETAMGVLRRVCDDTPRPLQQINPSVPLWLQTFIEKLLAKRPDDRYQSAEVVASLLKGMLAHLQQPASVPLPIELQPSKWTRHVRHNWRLAVAAAPFIVLAILGLAAWKPNPVADTSTSSATQNVVERSPEDRQQELPWNDGLEDDLNKSRTSLQNLESEPDF